MSFAAIAWAADQTPANATDKLVLIALANYVSKGGSGTMCHPGQDTIAQFAVCSVDTVQRSLKRLEQSGYIRIEKAKESNGQRTFDRYHLRIKVTTTSPDGTHTVHTADCGMDDENDASYAKSDDRNAIGDPQKTQAANCGMDDKIHTANHAANHTANHAAICGPNLSNLTNLNNHTHEFAQVEARPDVCEVPTLIDELRLEGTAIHVVDAYLAKLHGVLRAPGGEINLLALMRAIRDQLQAYDAIVLEAAADLTLRRRTIWPSAPQARQLVDEAARDVPLLRFNKDHPAFGPWIAHYRATGRSFWARECVSRGFVQERSAVPPITKGTAA